MTYVSSQYQSPLASEAYVAATAKKAGSAAAAGVDSSQTRTTDSLTISPEAVFLNEQQFQARFARKEEAVTADGVVVVQRTAVVPGTSLADPDKDVYLFSFTGKAGNSFSFDFAGDVRVSRNGDGDYSVYFADADTTRTYGADGTYVESPGDAGDADADAVYVSASSGSTITAGNGNNTIFIYGDQTTVVGGNGNDVVVVAEGTRGHDIDTGRGDDSVRGRFIDCAIDLGEGDNTIAGNAVGGVVKAGNGDNVVNMASDGARITLGHGNNAITGQLTNGARLVAGDGNNTFDAYSLGHEAHLTVAAGSGSVTFGNGDNTVKVYELLENSSITLGNGNNNLDIYELEGSSSLHMGNGDNIVTIYETEDRSSVSIGNGDNTVRIYSVANESSLRIGNGDNIIEIYEILHDAAVTLGDGDNSLRIYEMENESRLHVGDGQNSAIIGVARNSASVTFGDGDNAVIIALIDMASLLFGGGNNLWVGGSSKKTKAEFGDGDNRVVARSAIEGELAFGKGENVVLDSDLETVEDLLLLVMEWEAARRERLGLDLPPQELSDLLAFYLPKETASGETPKLKWPSDLFGDQGTGTGEARRSFFSEDIFPKEWEPHISRTKALRAAERNDFSDVAFFSNMRR